MPASLYLCSWECCTHLKWMWEVMTHIIKAEPWQNILLLEFRGRPLPSKLSPETVFSWKEKYAYWVVGKVLMYFSYVSERSVIYIKNKINPWYTALFVQNLLPSFSEFHNSLFIEGPVFIGEKQNRVLIYTLIWIEHCTMQGVLKRAKQVEVWQHQHKVRWVWWVC